MEKTSLTAQAAVPVFEMLMREKVATRSRLLDDGNVKLDSSAVTPHALDGSIVRVRYVKAGDTREHYHEGPLIDILRARDGSVYFRIMSKHSDSEGAGYRCFNPSKGNLTNMEFNP